MHDVLLANSIYIAEQDAISVVEELGDGAGSSSSPLLTPRWLGIFKWHVRSYQVGLTCDILVTVP